MFKSVFSPHNLTILFSCQVDGLDEMHPDAFMDPGFLNGSQDMSGHGRGLGPPGRGRGGPPPPR